MAEITAALVKELREKSGAGMMDCKKALIENDGDVEAAIDWLRAKGIAKADKKSGRTAAEGLIGINGAGTSAYQVRATVFWEAGGAGEQSVVIETAIAPRPGTDPDPDRRP
ncbi:MAG: hypothetical protein ACK4UZ_13220, partial [Rhizobium rhizophilum]